MSRPNSEKLKSKIWSAEDILNFARKVVEVEQSIDHAQPKSARDETAEQKESAKVNEGSKVVVSSLTRLAVDGIFSESLPSQSKSTTELKNVVYLDKK